MDPKNAEPLYYAIIRLFADGCERTSENVLAELEPTYGSRKLFTLKGESTRRLPPQERTGC